MGRLVRDGHMAMGYVIDELPMAQGWAMHAWLTEHDAWDVQERVGLGYVGQEARETERRRNGDAERRRSGETGNGELTTDDAGGADKKLTEKLL